MQPAHDLIECHLRVQNQLYPRSSTGALFLLGGGGGGKTVLSSSLINGDSDCFFLILGCFEKMDEEYMSNLSYFRFSKNLKEEQFSLAAFLGVVGIEG